MNTLIKTLQIKPENCGIKPKIFVKNMLNGVTKSVKK